MNQDAKTQATARLKRISGQLNGVLRMVTEDRCCVDVMVQLASIRAALRGIGKIILASHLDECVSTALSHGTPDERSKKMAELLDVFARFGGL